MPRKARIDAPGAIQHIIFRGIERSKIFIDPQDHQNFINRLEQILSDAATPCLAWVLMPNHVHLLLRTGAVPIATLMRRLLTGYAQQFNRRRKRHGPVFQNRYKSFLCQEERYLKELVRYIHLNPVRAGIVKDLQQLACYGLAGHAVLLGKSKCPWQDTDYVLGYFGSTIPSARKAYTAYVRKGLHQGKRFELTGGGLIRSHGGWDALKAKRSSEMRLMGDERILGSSDFVESVLKRAEERYEKHTRAAMRGITLKHVIEIVADHFKLDRKVLSSASRQRKVALARSIVCCLAVDQLRISGAEIARYLDMSPSSISKLAARGRVEPLAQKMADRVFD